MKKIRVGCCGFTVGREKYYKDFKVVEIQKTFYQPPQEKTAEKWRNEAPSDFEFTLKAWQLITHSPKSPTYRKLKLEIPEKEKKNYGFFKPTDGVFQAWEKTEKIASILKARAIVFQCPKSFEPTGENIKNFERFFKKIKRKKYLFAWEPRGDWEEKKIIKLCGKLNLIYCVDPFKNTPYPQKIGYLRLHGRGGYRYKYTNSDLKELKKICGRFPEVYCMFNNVYMWDDALRFKKMIS
jgi:uncharacterized protein YecE (DUF72 family)